MLVSDFTFEWILRHTVSSVEKGYVHNPADRGGPTCWGITEATANEPKHRKVLIERFGWNGRMQDLPQAGAFWIYEESWWRPLKCDELLKIHPFIADRVFDVGINAGRERGARWLQEILNVLNRQQKDYADIVPDGKIGKATLGALTAYHSKRGTEGLETLIQYLLGEQSHHYKSISESRPLNEEFTYGWGNRVKEINRLYQSVLNPQCTH